MLAKETAILSPFTSKLAPSRVVWTGEDELAFNNICACISNTCKLTIPLPEDVMSIVLMRHWCLQVRRGDRWEAAAFYSQQIRGAEQRYSATELEALVLVKHFGYYLYGKLFTVSTDHQPLCHLLTSNRLNGRLKRLAMKLQHWLLEIEYLPGVYNGLADALSREERPRRTETVIRMDSGLGGYGGTAPLKIRLRGKPVWGVPGWNFELLCIVLCFYLVPLQNWLGIKTQPFPGVVRSHGESRL